VKNRLAPAEIDDLFDLRYHTRRVDEIFRRVFGEN
jgi:adenylosuccinate lyase